MAPKSDPDEINELDKGWKEPLDNIFSSHIPIVIGYGGNDGSLMTYFEKMNKPSNFFWCGLDESDLSSRVKTLIEQMDGSFVKIDGFDEIMHELLWVFDEIKPIDEELEEITKLRIETADKQLIKITETNAVAVEEQGQPKKELSALEYSELAESELDYEKRKEIYLEALNKFPKTSWLWNEFTYFLHSIKKDYDNLEEYYLKALEIAPDNANNNSNYALFLTDIKKDFDNAEQYFLKALYSNPSDPHLNGNYAMLLFLLEKRDDAILYLNKAFELNQNKKHDLLIELWFYRYAHCLETIEESQKEIEFLLSEGIRSEFWNLKANVDKAIKDGHPNPEKLKEFAFRITGLKY